MNQKKSMSDMNSCKNTKCVQRVSDFLQSTSQTGIIVSARRWDANFCTVSCLNYVIKIKTRVIFFKLENLIIVRKSKSVN